MTDLENKCRTRSHSMSRNTMASNTVSSYLGRNAEKPKISSTTLSLSVEEEENVISPNNSAINLRQKSNSQTPPNRTNCESSSSSTLTSEEPGYAVSASDVERWMNHREDVHDHPANDIRSPRPTFHQRTMTPTPTTVGTEQFNPGSSNVWSILAMLMSIMRTRLRYQPTAPINFMSTSQHLMAHMATICDRARDNFRRMTEEQLEGDLLATVVDIFLVVYTFVFILQSIYETTLVR